MGRHSAACTLDTYGHLIDEELSNALDLGGRTEGIGQTRAPIPGIPE